MSGARPITKQRSKWVKLDHRPMVGAPTDVYARDVHDGHLMALVSDEPAGLHLSISHRSRGRTSRYPTWDEITHARRELLPADRGFVMHLPAEAEYVAVHDTCFHLFEHPERGAS